jgi:hypothetical protein
MNLLDLARAAWLHDRGGALATVAAAALLFTAALLGESLS